MTVKIDFTGLNKNPTVIIIVQILRLFPVIQNIKRVMNIYFEGDFANSHPFCNNIFIDTCPTKLCIFRVIDSLYLHFLTLLARLNCVFLDL